MRGQTDSPFKKLIGSRTGALAPVPRSRNYSESPESPPFGCLDLKRNPPLPGAKHFFNRLLRG